MYSNTRKRKYNCNDNYFENIDSEEKAYWLGFLMADGCVQSKRKFKLTLQIRDYSHLEKFKKSIDSDNLIYIWKNKNNREYCEIVISSTKMVESLEKLGCVSRKTKIVKFPPNLNDKLIRHWIRGYFDGDGCIHRDEINKTNVHISIASSSVIMLEDILKNIIKLTSCRTNIGSIYSKYGVPKLDFHSVEALNLINSLFYEEANIFLQRKKNIFNSYHKTSKIFYKNQCLKQILNFKEKFSNNDICKIFEVSPIAARKWTNQLFKLGKIKYINKKGDSKNYIVI